MKKMFDVCAYRDDDFIQQFLCVYLSPRSFPMFSIAYCVCVCVDIYIHIHLRVLSVLKVQLCASIFIHLARASSN